MLGKPKYKVGDRVSFNIKLRGKEYIVIGNVYIVDDFGTFLQTEEPSYDILSKEIKDDMETSGDCLYKHVRESTVSRSKKEIGFIEITK